MGILYVYTCMYVYICTLVHIMLTMYKIWPGSKTLATHPKNDYRIVSTGMHDWPRFGLCICHASVECRMLLVRFFSTARIDKWLTQARCSVKFAIDEGENHWPMRIISIITSMPTIIASTIIQELEDRKSVV